VQVDPIKPAYKAPGIKLLTLKYDNPLSSSAFEFNLRRYIQATAIGALQRAGQYVLSLKVGRCRLTLSNPS